MKNSILVLAISTLTIGSFFIGCNTPSEKVENAVEKVNDANRDLAKANENYNNDVNNYKKEEAAKIAANEQSIVEFKARIANEKKDAKEKYLKEIANLEQKNSDMKKQIDDYKADSKENWVIFRTKFSHDMDELGKAFKSFVTPSK